MPTALVYAYPEPEGPVRSWLRALNLAGVGARWFFGVPSSPTFPLGLISVISPVPVRGVPVVRAVMQLDLMGATPTPGQPPSDKYALATIANALVGAAESLPAGTIVVAATESTPAVVCLGAEVENGPVWAPDRGSGSGRARYTTDIAFTLRFGRS